MKSTFQKTISAINEGQFDIALVGLFSLLKPFVLTTWVFLSFWLITKIQIPEPEGSIMSSEGLFSVLYLGNSVLCVMFLLVRTMYLIVSFENHWSKMHQKYQSYQPHQTKANQSGFTLEEYDPYAQVFGLEAVATEADLLADEANLMDDGFTFEDEDLVLEGDVRFETEEDFLSSLENDGENQSD